MSVRLTMPWALALLVVIGLPLIAKADDRDDQLIAKASRFVKAEKWEKAIALFERIDAAGEGCDNRCLMPWSVALERLRRYSASLDVLERAFANAPGDRQLLDRLLRVYDRRNQGHRGIRSLRDHLEHLVADDPTRLWAENELGVRLMTSPNAAEAQFRQAERAFQRALDIHAESVVARINLARAQERQARAVDAMATLDSLPPIDGLGSDGSALNRASALRTEVDRMRVLSLSEMIVDRLEAQGYPWDQLGVDRAGRRLEDVRAADRAGYEPPRLIHQVQPEYTEIARAARIQGVVLLQVKIDHTGKVTDVRVTKDLPMGLTEKAVEAAWKLRFEPARRFGAPEASVYSFTSNFRLQ